MLKYYGNGGGGPGLNYETDAWLLLQQIQKRIGDTNWFYGAKYLYMGPDTTFHRLLWDDAQMLPAEKIKLVADDKIRRVVMCSGKVYYDLYEEREKRGIDDVYLLRVEQLYPVPLKALVNELGRFPKAQFMWCQEEPRNMGAYAFMEPYLEWVLAQLGAQNKQPVYAGRASPQTFGHTGWGGTMGFADLGAGIGFGYVTNRMLGFDNEVDPRRKVLIDAVYDSL